MNKFTHRFRWFLLAIAGFLYSCSEPKSLPVVDGPALTFVVFSDVQQGYGIFSQLAYRIGELDPVPVAAFCCGDLMLRSGNEAEAVSFLDCIKPITDRTALYLARGNHDGNDPGDEAVLRELFAFPPDHFYFSLRSGSSLFIVLDTQEKGRESSISGPQLQWLEQTLDSAAATARILHVFLFMHHPLYPQGFHKGDNLQHADELHALFLRYPKIKAVFAGHDHFFNDYVRDGLHYITTGGAGGALYHGAGGDYHHFVKVTCPEDDVRVTLSTIGIFNEVIDTLSF